MDVRAYKREAWDRLVENQNRWTVPVTTAEIQRARNGDWQIVLTPTKPVPKSWFPDLDGASTLCLASGGGQQGPILAAAGATVTVLDASPRQLEQDRAVAEREGLSLETIEGDMADLSMFVEATFDLIVWPTGRRVRDYRLLRRLVRWKRGGPAVEVSADVHGDESREGGHYGMGKS